MVKTIDASNVKTLAILLLVVWVALGIFYPNVFIPSSNQHLDLQQPQFEQTSGKQAALHFEANGQKYRAECSHFAVRAGQNFCDRAQIQSIKNLQAKVVLQPVLHPEQEIVIERLSYMQAEPADAIQTIQLSASEIDKWTQQLMMPVYGLRTLFLLSLVLIGRRFWRLRQKKSM